MSESLHRNSDIFRILKKKQLIFSSFYRNSDIENYVFFTFEKERKGISLKASVSISLGKSRKHRISLIAFHAMLSFFTGKAILFRLISVLRAVIAVGEKIKWWLILSVPLFVLREEEY